MKLVSFVCRSFTIKTLAGEPAGIQDAMSLRFLLPAGEGGPKGRMRGKRLRIGR